VFFLGIDNVLFSTPAKLHAVFEAFGLARVLSSQLVFAARQTTGAPALCGESMVVFSITG